MIPDSVIAENFVLGKTSLAYTISHGLAPYFHFHDMLFTQIKDCNFIIALF